MIKLLEAVEEVEKFLESQGWPYVIIGGLAVQVWGKVRMTQDVDIAVSINPDQRIQLVKAAKQKFKLIPEEPDRFIETTNVLPIETNSGVQVDLICAWTDFEREVIRRAREIEMESNFKVRVCTSEDLVIMKFISDRPRDREDVEGVLVRSGKTMNHSYVLQWLERFEDILDKHKLISEYNAYLERWVDAKF